MSQRILNIPERITKREWYCVLIAAHCTVGRRSEALRIIEKGIGKDGVPERFFSELFLHLSLLLGFPTMLEGLSMLRTIAVKSNTSYRKSARGALVTKQGRKTLERVYGSTLDRLLTNLRFLHDIIPDVIVHDVYGRIISRRGLSLREREIVNVAVLSIQRLDQQLYSHIRGALRVHVSEETLRVAIQTGARIARTSPRTSLNLLASLAGSKKSLP
jgi:alkylhydroperoxidase/carboxymuconolactone decarboxylase family protein YurZ